MSRVSGTHSKLWLWGSFAGLRPVRPSPMVLDLPPSDTGAPWHIRGAAAGAKHLALLATEGQIILMGNNKQGQIGQPISTVGTQGLGLAQNTGAVDPMERLPYLYDLELSPEERPDSIACGCNYNIFYRKGTRTAIVVGNNLYAQLALGHKEILDNSKGFAEWNTQAPWWQELDRRATERAERAVAAPSEFSQMPSDMIGIKKIVCGHNHTLILMDDGTVMSCGSNTWGELGLGHYDSPVQPTMISTFEDMEEKDRVVDMAAGNSWSMFLTATGRVYGCGAHQQGQLGELHSRIPRLLAVCRPEHAEEKLLKVKRIAAGADHSVFVSKKNELFFRGSLIPAGVTTGSRYQQIKMPEDFNGGISLVKASSCTTFVVSTDGHVYGFGLNAEGQIHLDPGRVNLAPNCYEDSLQMIMRCKDPSAFREIAGLKGTQQYHYCNQVLAISHGFGVLVDHHGLYEPADLPKEEENPTVYFPPRKRALASPGMRRKAKF